MLLASYKAGKLHLTVVKDGLPGIVLVQRTDDSLFSVDFNGGTCRRVVSMRAKPKAVRWVPSAAVENTRS